MIILFQFHYIYFVVVYVMKSELDFSGFIAFIKCVKSNNYIRKILVLWKLLSKKITKCRLYVVTTMKLAKFGTQWLIDLNFLTLQLISNIWDSSVQGTAADGKKFKKQHWYQNISHLFKETNTWKARKLNSAKQ